MLYLLPLNEALLFPKLESMELKASVDLAFIVADMAETVTI